MSEKGRLALNDPSDAAIERFSNDPQPKRVSLVDISNQMKPSITININVSNSTVRNFELGNVGAHSTHALSSSTYFNIYVIQIRRNIKSLYKSFVIQDVCLDYCDVRTMYIYLNYEYTAYNTHSFVICKYKCYRFLASLRFASLRFAPLQYT